jgi:hypothetical protein
MERSSPPEKGGWNTTRSPHNPPELGEGSHASDGVDLTLIRRMLSLTPGERLLVLQNNLRSILKARASESRA